MASTIIFSEKGCILNDNQKICNHEHLLHKTNTLNLKPYQCYNVNINKTISKFDNHINIKNIKEDITLQYNRFLHLNVKKSSTSSFIPAPILKQSMEIYLPF